MKIPAGAVVVFVVVKLSSVEFCVDIVVIIVVMATVVMLTIALTVVVIVSDGSRKT